MRGSHIQKNPKPRRLSLLQGPDLRTMEWTDRQTDGRMDDTMDAQTKPCTSKCLFPLEMATF